MTPTELLFGEFPRKVATSGPTRPDQHHVFSKGEFEVFLDRVRETRNVYSTISKMPIVGSPVTDKVPFDFDSPMKYSAFTEDENDCEKIEKMRDDEWLASNVLGEVLADTKKLASYARDNDIPAIGVFSGLGMHFYLLYKPETYPKDELRTTNRKLTDELSLETSDTVVAQPERILRVPNCRRVDMDGDDLVVCDMWTTPIMRNEVEDLTVDDLLDLCKSQRKIELDEAEYGVGARPELEVYDDYITHRPGDREIEEMQELSEVPDAMVSYILDNQVEMPCISKRVRQRNPRHKTRFVFAVQLFNLGYSVDDCVEIIEKLQWKDFDREKTRTYLQQIYNHGYNRWSCNTMMKEGLCVYPEKAIECPTFMEKGEPCRWK